jgi:hypothetical protein
VSVTDMGAYRDRKAERAAAMEHLAAARGARALADEMDRRGAATLGDLFDMWKAEREPEAGE